MSKATWGVTVAVVAAIVAVVFAASQGLLTEETAMPTAGDSQTTGSQADGTSTAESRETSEGGEPATGDGADDAEAALEAEAESYVEQLGEPTDEPIRVESAEGFASPDQPVASRADDEDDTTAAGESGDVDATAGQSVSGESGADEPGSEASGDATRTEVEAAQAPAATTQAAPAEAEAVAPIEVSDTTAAVGDGGSGPSDTEAPRVDLPLTEQSPVTLADLIGPEETIPSDAVLYVHTVTPRDDEGIWGIVHEGILENFARGVAVHRGESTETYQVDIPEDADQRRPDNSSSFLGRLIYEKTQQSYVYNYETERIGRNPDLILPGEEIVIVSFTPEELVSVYKHFVRSDGQNES